ncbi:MAG: flavin reductase family protein [Xanthobacteraceae bacterium]|uniref:flavin reductase family protein n=1 Tax=Pseudolabrys sp. TaxID=1960880 RepID=UPI003D0DEDF3
MTGDDAAPLRDSFRAAMRRFTATVSVVSSCLDGARHGMTATAVTSVSLDPPSLLVCVNRNGRLFEMLERSPRFCVNVLHAGQSAVSRTFAQPHSAERFAQGEWDDDEFGIPYLRDAQVAIFCAKAQAVPHGSHSVFFGNVEQVRLRDDIAPLLYQDGAYGVCGPLAVRR